MRVGTEDLFAEQFKRVAGGKRNCVAVHAFQQRFAVRAQRLQLQFLLALCAGAEIKKTNVVTSGKCRGFKEWRFQQLHLRTGQLQLSAQIEQIAAVAVQIIEFRV